MSNFNDLLNSHENFSNAKSSNFVNLPVQNHQQKHVQLRESSNNPQDIFETVLSDDYHAVPMDSTDFRNDLLSIKSLLDEDENISQYSNTQHENDAVTDYFKDILTDDPSLIANNENLYSALDRLPQNGHTSYYLNDENPKSVPSLQSKELKNKKKPNTNNHEIENIHSQKLILSISFLVCIFCFLAIPPLGF